MPRDLTFTETALAMSILDPGHSSESLTNASPYPDGKLGKHVVMLPAQLEYDLTVPATGFTVVALPPNPFVALLNYASSGGNVYGVYWPHTSSSTLRGRWMLDQHVEGVRCLGKSMTVTNVTPAVNRGGVVYTNAYNLECITRAPAVAENTAITSAANQFSIAGLPITPASIVNTPGYGSFSCDEGCYCVCRPKSMELNAVKTSFQQLSSLYTSSTPSSATTTCNALVYTASTVDDNAATTAILDANNPTFTMPVPGIVDGMDTVVACLVGSSAAQTYHVKVHALYEVVIEPQASALIRGCGAVPNSELVRAIEMGFDSVPRFMPASMNAAGAIWKWFKQFYRDRGQTTLAPLIKSFPILGPTAESMLSHLSEYSPAK